MLALQISSETYSRSSMLLKIPYLDDHHDANTGVWVAGTDDDNEGRWEWADSSSYRLIQGYTNWHRGEPDSGQALVPYVWINFAYGRTSVIFDEKDGFSHYCVKNSQGYNHFMP